MTGTREIIEKFLEFLPADSIIADAETQRPYECDGLPVFHEKPLITVLPRNKEQVQKLMAVCHDLNVPVVARGAGTGLSAGAMPNKNGVLLSLAKLNQIIEIDPIARIARVEPGVTNSAVSEAAKRYGLYYAPDPSSQIACTIGGNFAENSGGVHCLKYGLTVHNMCSAEVITADGNPILIGSEAKDTQGFDLMAIMIGSEGMLGVVVEITLKLLPIPEIARVVMAGFPSVQKAGDAVSEVIARGIIPAGLEMMDNLAIKASEDFAHAGYPVECEALLLCELDGTRNEVEQHTKTVANLFSRMEASSVRISNSEAERMLMWKGRKSAFPAMGRISADYYCMDGTIPRRQISNVLSAISDLSAKYGLRVANVFHAGDGNLHPLILFDAGNPDELERAEELGGKILELCVQAGGTITGEHGVGLEKLRQMPAQFSDDEIEQFLSIKEAFDPKFSLNPGKGIPSLKQCQEYRSLGQSLRHG